MPLDFQTWSAIVFVIFLTIFFIVNRKKFTIQKIVFPIIYFSLYKTKIGIKLMDKIAKKFPRSLHWLSVTGVFVGFLGMLFIFGALVYNLWNILTVPDAAPGVALVLPFEVKGAIYVPFFYFIISLTIIAGVHEFMHGVMARLYKFKVKSSGFAFLSVIFPIIPAAFVEPDEKALTKGKTHQQLGVFAAGPMANVITAALMILLVFMVFAPLAGKIYQQGNGVKIVGVTEGSPTEAAGLMEDEVIIQVDDRPTDNIANFTGSLDDKQPGDVITITTTEREVELTLAGHPEESSKAFMGIQVRQLTEVRPSFLEKYPKFLAEVFTWFAGLVQWLYLLSLGIGLFNLVPLGPIDGGRMLGTVLHTYFSPKVATKIWGTVSIVTLALIVLSVFSGLF